ncbi:hypothetical protein [Dokdonia sp.]|uniref:hypothetical protein n=1 Tax=Dokdonia sp. TaxID=2024995 RepID=UPI003262DA8A
MKIIKLTIVLFLAFTCIGHAQKNKTRSVDQALNILLADYAKVSSVKAITLKDYKRYLAKNNLNAKSMKIKKVVALTYYTKKKQIQTIYIIKRLKGMSFSGPSCNFNNDIVAGDIKALCDNSGEECVIITDECVLDDCSFVCVISNSCDEDGESYPDCCADGSCADGDGIKGDLSTPLETLMG